MLLCLVSTCVNYFAALHYAKHAVVLGLLTWIFLNCSPHALGSRILMFSEHMVRMVARVAAVGVLTLVVLFTQTESIRFLMLIMNIRVFLDGFGYIYIFLSQ